MLNDVEKEIIENIIEKTDYAFQPIVNVHSGMLIAVEALLRNTRDAGFDAIEDVFDYACDHEVLYQLDLALRKKAIEKYSSIPIDHEFKLFFNIDNRVLRMPDYKTGNTTRLLEEYGIEHRLVCFEISEKIQLHDYLGLKEILTNYREQNFYIAIDDYGAGFSGLKQLYTVEPDFIKIDRFFISGMNSDARKKKFVANMVNLAHIIGVQIIAEGVETAEEFAACREIGCEYVQGFFVQEPMIDVKSIQVQYDHIRKIAGIEKRDRDGDRELIKTEMEEYRAMVLSESSTDEIFNYFRHNSNRSLMPVINAYEEPVGIIQEAILKKYVYSPYGRELLRNKKSASFLRKLISTVPVCELTDDVESIIESFNRNAENVGILLTEKGRYRGYLSARSLLKLINQKNVAFARNQNPLTKLPGNSAIMEKLSRLNEAPDAAVCYFDFDNFKPFNDKYGFRTGDRGIMMFADILNMYSSVYNCFVGHIGGDDFVLIEYGVDSIEALRKRIKKDVIEEFRLHVENLYDDTDRMNGAMEGIDRFGVARSFPLLTVSCVLIDVKNHSNPDTIPLTIADQKKMVKMSDKSIIVV